MVIYVQTEQDLGAYTEISRIPVVVPDGCRVTAVQPPASQPISEKGCDTSPRAVPLDAELETILVCAERYVCGRHALAWLVIDYIRPLLPSLSNRALKVLERDLDIPDAELGDPQIDAPGWRRLLQDIRQQLKKREDDHGDE